jgi:hypothetical protein
MYNLTSRALNLPQRLQYSHFMTYKIEVLTLVSNVSTTCVISVNMPLQHYSSGMWFYLMLLRGTSIFRVTDQVPLKHWYVPSKLHIAMAHKTYKIFDWHRNIWNKWSTYVGDVLYCICLNIKCPLPLDTTSVFTEIHTQKPLNCMCDFKVPPHFYMEY